MPSNTWGISVTFSKKTKGGLTSEVYFSDKEAFDRAVRLLEPEKAAPKYETGQWVSFRGDEHDPKLATLLALLKEQGLTPAEHTQISIEDSETFFVPSIERTYSKQELDESEYLCVGVTSPPP